MKNKLAYVVIMILLLSSMCVPIAMGAGADPANLHTTDVTSTSIAMTWDDNVTDETYYRISRQINGGAWEVIQWAYYGGNTFTDSNLTQNTTYSYQVQAIKEVAGTPYYDQNPSNILVVTTPIDPTPTNLQATATSFSTINLTWQNNAITADYIRVDRRTSTGTFEVIQWSLPGSSTTYSDVGLTPSTTYIYRVYAIQLVGGNPHYYGTYSNEASATTQALPPALVIPAAPSNLTATVDGGHVALHWANNATNADSVVIERRIKGSSSIDSTNTVSASSTTFTDNSVIAGTTYEYRVLARNGAGDSAYSNVAEVTVPQSNQPPNGTSTTIVLYIGKTTYYVNNVVHTLDSPPVTIEDRTLLPIRFVIEPLGGTVSWSEPDQKVTIQCNGHSIELVLGQNRALVDGMYQLIDPANPAVVPTLIHNRTMVPVRFVSENIGCDVQYLSSDESVHITYNP